jgi:putative transposase
MAISSEIRQGRHCIFKIHVHLVFITKYRKAIFDADALKSLEKDISGGLS